MSTLFRSICGALLICELAIPASAANFDCTKATTPVERVVCANPALSAADDRLAERFAAAMARTLDPQTLRREQRKWLALTRRQPPVAEYLAQSYRDRIDVFDRLIAELNALEPTRHLAEVAARAECPVLSNALDPLAALTAACAAAGFGKIGAVDGKEFLYGLYDSRGRGSDTPTSTDIVIYRREAAEGQLYALFAPQSDATFYAEPQILMTAGRTLLHLPGTVAGTGYLNDERLFVWRAGGWADVDTTSWLDDLVHRLPFGYGAWKGIYPDYRTLSAATPLWRRSDAHCCPTGGRADIAFGWSGDRIVVKGVEVKYGVKYAKEF